MTKGKDSTFSTLALRLITAGRLFHDKYLNALKMLRIFIVPIEIVSEKTNIRGKSRHEKKKNKCMSNFSSKSLKNVPCSNFHTQIFHRLRYAPRGKRVLYIYYIIYMPIYELPQYTEMQNRRCLPF